MTTKALVAAAILILPGAASYGDTLILNGEPYAVFQNGPYTNIYGGGGSYTVTQDGPYINVTGSSYSASPVVILDSKQMPWVDPDARPRTPQTVRQPKAVDSAPRAMPIKKRYPDYQADVERSKPRKKESAFVHWLKHGI